jgi:hypothetical protein
MAALVVISQQKKILSWKSLWWEENDAIWEIHKEDFPVLFFASLDGHCSCLTNYKGYEYQPPTYQPKHELRIIVEEDEDNPIDIFTDELPLLFYINDGGEIEYKMLEKVDPPPKCRVALSDGMEYEIYDDDFPILICLGYRVGEVSVFSKYNQSIAVQQGLVRARRFTHAGISDDVELSFYGWNNELLFSYNMKDSKPRVVERSLEYRDVETNRNNFWKNRVGN